MIRRNGYRPLLCNLHNRIFRGHGTSQVFHKIVFHFCAACWLTRREDCNDHMRRVVFGAAKKERAA
jgi:hypothetical protein